MTRQVAVVTGASAGIGRATAAKLAAAGWHVIGTGRDPARSAEAEAAIRAVAAPGVRVDFVRGDFDLMAEVARVARAIAALTDRVDILVNNAGGVRDARHVTGEGLEAMFAANHLAAFLLTRELTPPLRNAAAAAPAGAVRVIAVSSTAHQRCAALRRDDLGFSDGFTVAGAYAQAKLANLLFTRELARREAGAGIVAQAMHPGIVASNFASHGDAAMQAHFAASVVDSPDRAAETLVWLATNPEGGRAPGRYFFDRAEATPAPQALDDEAASWLWAESERLLARIGT